MSVIGRNLPDGKHLFVVRDQRSFNDFGAKQRMDHGKQSVVFRASRAKLLPIVILMPMLIFLPGAVSSAIIYRICSEGVVTLAEILMFIVMMSVFGIIIYGEILLIRRLINPDSLTLSTHGWKFDKQGKVSAHSWSDYGKPVERYFSAGKTGDFFIVMPSLNNEKPALIGEGQFKHSKNVIFKAVEEARLGRIMIVSPGVEPKSFIYLAIPCSIFSLTVFLTGVVCFARFLSTLS